MTYAVILFAVVLLAYANGANDNFKGAATLFGSGTTNYRGALAWATVATVFGSITALLLAGVFAVAVVMAVGGLVSARRVAETMSRRITPMNHGQGFTANLITGAIVIGASKLGMPVSTAHVSCGALFGIGTVTRRARIGMIGTILAAWITTLPVAAVLGAVSYRVVTWL